jgi:hypothetical protein
MRTEARHQLAKSRSPRPSNPFPADKTAIDHAVKLISWVCRLAGATDFIDNLQLDRGRTSLRAIISRGDNIALFNWLIESVSYQGIADRVAHDYMQRHGRLTWQEVQRGLAGDATCPKLTGYWRFHDCRYDKGSRTCAEPDHIRQCPLPQRNLRNGRLNQTGYSLFLFIRDVADGDLIGWIDAQLRAAGEQGQGGAADAQEALLGPLRNVYGVADKVLMMTLSSILISAPASHGHWFEAGIGMVAVDTLVHAFLHRTGILQRFGAAHPYGLACYQPTGCADVIREVACHIDARAYNPAFPALFPRFIQSAVWRYCAQQGLDICNGNRIDDRKSCSNIQCELHSICDRKTLYFESN